MFQSNTKLWQLKVKRHEKGINVWAWRKRSSSGGVNWKKKRKEKRQYRTKECLPAKIGRKATLMWDRHGAEFIEGWTL